MTHFARLAIAALVSLTSAGIGRAQGTAGSSGVSAAGQPSPVPLNNVRKAALLKGPNLRDRIIKEATTRGPESKISESTASAAKLNSEILKQLVNQKIAADRERAQNPAALNSASPRPNALNSGLTPSPGLNSTLSKPAGLVPLQQATSPPANSLYQQSTTAPAPLSSSQTILKPATGQSAAAGTGGASGKTKLSANRAPQTIGKTSPQLLGEISKTSPFSSTLSVRSTASPLAMANAPASGLLATPTTTAVCLQPTIQTVDGHSSDVWFTPINQDNPYTIVGCGFGVQKGSLYLYGPFASSSRQVAMSSDYWSDTLIVAHVDPTVSGEIDQRGNVNLVVSTAGGQQVQKTGFDFYAERATVRLTTFPQSAVNLQQITDTASNRIAAQYLSPAQNFPNYTLEVARSESGEFGGGTDLISFGNLTKGFVFDNAQFSSNDLTQSSCQNPSSSGVAQIVEILLGDPIPGVFKITDATFYVDGNWSETFNANYAGALGGVLSGLGASGSSSATDNAANQGIPTFVVTTQEEHCHIKVPGGSDDFSLSDYGLIIWVTGPRGVNPFPGN